MDQEAVRAYLQRMGCPAIHGRTYETLRSLQTAHLRTVPYENLDIVEGVPLSLAPEALFAKIVTRRRGGYCFELNALFGALLRAMGFDVQDHFSRFLLGEVDIPMRRHHVLAVRVPGQSQAYLCDVGVGAISPSSPMPLIEGHESAEGAITYRLLRDSFLGWVLTFNKDGEWKRLYSFTEEPQLSVDFVAVSYYCEHSPDSIFNKAAKVAIRTSEGRYTLDSNTFKHFCKDQVTVWQEEPGQPYDRTLHRLFGICRSS